MTNANKQKQEKIRKRWVAALRSGKYEQGQSRLKTKKDNRPAEFCCLGVLCDLAVKSRVIPGANKYQIETGHWEYAYDGSDAFLPHKVKEWAGLTSTSGDFQPSSNKVDSLASMNDNGKTFEEIAKVIESEPEGLFE